MKRNLIMPLACMLLFGTNAFAQNQLVLSESWQGTGGLQSMFHRNVTKTDLNGYVYVAGSTVNSGGHYDIFLQKFDNEGYLLWDVSYDGAAGLDDVASDIVITSAGDYIYLTGTSVESSSQGADMILIKYADDGTLQWAETYDNGQTAPDNQDFGTSIAIDVTDQLIVVAGASNASGSDMDYLMNAYDDSGNLVWSYNYNYSGHDVAAKVIEDGGTFIITGLSQNSSIEWKVATVEIDASGTYLSENRTGSTSPAVNEVYDLTVDGSGNFYIAAAFYNEFEEFNMTTLKLDNTLTLAWTATYSGSTSLEDKAKAVRVDGSGNVYVVGYATEQNKDLVLIKYNSSGTEVWKRTFDGGGDDEGVGLVLANGHVYVTGKTHNGSDYDFVTLAFTASGELVSQVTFAGSAGEDDIPNAITTDGMGNVIVTGQEGLTASTKSAVTIKYDAFEMDLESVNDISSKPLFAKHHIIVKFEPSVVNTAFIDNINQTAGKIEDVLDGATVSDLERVLDVTLVGDRRVRVIKIFPGLTSADVISTSRSGYPVPIPHFQSWLILTLPNGLVADDAVDLLLNDNVSGFEWAEADVAFELAGANDTQYGSQSSLQPTGTYPDAHINVDDAWDVYNAVGADWIKVGIVDNGIWWANNDFGSGTVASYQNSVIKGGYHFQNSTSLPNLTASGSYYGHGTSTASIVGAIRDNSNGIAGMAGGDSPTAGVALYDMRVCCGVPNLSSSYVSTLSDAIIEGSKSGNQPYNGLHILNMSLATNGGSSVSPYLFLLRNAMRFAYANGVVCVAARTEDDVTSNNYQVYPACLKDEWQISVGGSNIDGEYGLHHLTSTLTGFNSYIENVDVVAPADYRNIVVLDDNSSGTVSAGGTSMSAAHVSGLAAMMMSVYNENTPAYKNLWPEDIENIIKNTADDIAASPASSGPDDYTGFGKINATSAISVLEEPYYRVLHFTFWGNVSDITLEENLDSLYITEFLNNNNDQNVLSPLPAKFANVDMYSISGSVDHGNLITNSASILGYWKAESYSDSWPLAQQQGTRHIVSPLPYLEFTSWDATTAEMKGYLYFVNTGGLSGAWIPGNPNTSYYRLSYSVHVYDPTGYSGVEESIKQEGLQLFPNPSNSSSNLSFYIDVPQQVTISIIDMNGKVIDNLPILHCTNGWQTVQLNTEKYSTGVYYVSVSMGAGKKTVKLIKQ